MTKNEQIAAAARALRASLSGYEPGGTLEAAYTLDAALALPPDAPSSTERDRALVRAGWDAGQPTYPYTTEYASDVDGVIAAVDATHPRAATVVAAARTLDAALALPEDAPSSTERDRALVRAGYSWGIDAANGNGPTPVTDEIIAAVDATHPRAATVRDCTCLGHAGDDACPMHGTAAREPAAVEPLEAWRESPERIVGRDLALAEVVRLLSLTSRQHGTGQLTRNGGAMDAVLVAIDALLVRLGPGDAPPAPDLAAVRAAERERCALVCVVVEGRELVASKTALKEITKWTTWGATNAAKELAHRIRALAEAEKDGAK